MRPWTPVLATPDTNLTWNGNAAKWESFRDEIRVWRLGENLNVKQSLVARLVSGLSGHARFTCMIMDAEQLHPPLGEGLIATVDEHRNIVGLDDAMNERVAIVSFGEKVSCPQE